MLVFAHSPLRDMSPVQHLIRTLRQEPPITFAVQNSPRRCFSIFGHAGVELPSIRAMHRLIPRCVGVRDEQRPAASRSSHARTGSEIC